MAMLSVAINDTTNQESRSNEVIKSWINWWIAKRIKQLPPMDNTFNNEFSAKYVIHMNNFQYLKFSEKFVRKK